MSYDNQGEFSKKLFIETYGCQMNVADSEVVASVMKMAGYDTTDTLDAADTIFINTCSIRDNAEQKIFSRLNQLNALRRNRKRRLIVGIIGCMAERLKEVLINEYDVDIVAGPDSYLELPNLIASAEAGEKAIETTLSTTETYRDIIPQRISGNKVSGYISIMRGCNNFCTYCIVPYVRGRERSRRPEDIIGEVRELVSQGYKEIMLLGQNVNSYGNDLGGECSFPQLLRELNKIEGDFWIRFMSSHPKDASKELIDAIFDCEKVAKHLHLPVQSGSSAVLDRMNRRYTIEKYLGIVDEIRRRDDDFSLTTDIIVGFPNETDEEFRATLDVIKKVRYDNIYSFIYSKRSGTKAAEMPDSISDEEKGHRMRELLEVQREVSTEHYKRFIGRTMRVLVDGVSKKKDGWLTGKSSEFIIVEFEGDSSLIGQFADVEITDAMNWAVTGHIKKG